MEKKSIFVLLVSPKIYDRIKLPKSTSTWETHSEQRHNHRPFFNPHNNHQSIFPTRVQRGGTEDPLCSRCGDGVSSLDTLSANCKECYHNRFIGDGQELIAGDGVGVWWRGCDEDGEKNVKVRANFKFIRRIVNLKDFRCSKKSFFSGSINRYIIFANVKNNHVET